jgi:hypothetical protein
MKRIWKYFLVCCEAFSEAILAQRYVCSGMNDQARKLMLK